MRSKRVKWMQHVIVFVLVIAMLLPMTTPVSVQAAESDLYLAYQEDESGTTVTKLKKNQREAYKVTNLFLNVGDKADLCFINASMWKNAQWTSSNTRVVTIDSSGILTAVSAGVAEVTLTYSKKITNKKVSASAKIYVGEENWNIEFAAGEFFLKGYGGRYDSYDLKVGGDMQLHIYGLGDITNSPIYRLTLESSNEPSVQTIQDCVFARKAGTATITAKVINNITGSVLEKQLVVNVTNPVYTEATEWDNPYYQMYGENYKRLFQNPSYLMLATADIEKDMLDDALNLLEKKMETLHWRGMGELVNLVNGLTIAAQGVMHGMDYLDKEAQRDATMYLIQKLITESQGNLYENNVETALKNAQELFDDLDNVIELSEQIKILETAGLNIKKTEIKSILDYLMDDASGDIAGALEKGVTATEYAALTLCLYDMDNQILDDLQACSYPGNPLYEGVELIRREREKDPLDYFRDKYCSEIFAEGVAELMVKLAGKEIMAFSNAVSTVVDMVLNMRGVPKLSETVKAQYLMYYIGEVKSKALNITWELTSKVDTYSDEELMKIIEDYENAYSLYLAMVAPAVEAVEALEKYGNNPVLSADAIIPAMGYDYNRHIATAMSAYMHQTPEFAHYEKVFTVLDSISETEVYSFQNVASGLYMNIDGGKSKNGTEIDLWSLDMSEPVSQRYVFKVVNAEKGIVSIAPEPSQNMYLDVRVDGGAFATGKEIFIWENDGDPHKNLLLESQPDGSFYITFAEYPGYCIGVATVEEASIKKTELTVCKKNGGAEQRWILCDKDGTPIKTVTTGYTTSMEYVINDKITHQGKVVYKNSLTGIEMLGNSFTEAHSFKDRVCQYCGAKKVDLSEEELRVRMEELVDKLLKANKQVKGNEKATEAYFTTTGKEYKADSGATCMNTKVVKAKWFMDNFGNVCVDNFPKHLPSKGNEDSNIGYSCFGFACFAQWYIYKNSNLDIVSAKQIVTGKYTKEFLANNLQAGDIIRIYVSKNGSNYYHSMVFHSFTENGMIVLDCNRNTDNKVRLNEIKYNRDGWSGDPVWIYRVQE